MTQALLRVSHLEKSFGGLKAVNGVSFDVPRGQITALIGPNGAGKTTLINLVTGLLPKSSGDIFLDGVDIGHLAAPDRVRAGISRSYQTPQMIRGLTVLENVIVGADLFSTFSVTDLFWRPWRVRRDNAIAREKARAALQRTELPETMWHLPAESLSYGEQRRVEIARTLAQEPSLLLLDEPAAGLNPRETEGLGEFLQTLAADGLSILLVEHDMPLVMSIAQKIVVVNFGELLAHGTPAEIQKNDQVIAAYLGVDPIETTVSESTTDHGSQHV